MRSIAETTRRSKKTKRLGPVRVIRPEQYADFDVNSKVECIQALIPLGLMRIHELLEDEVCALAGARYERKASRLPGRRHGRNPGSVRLAGQRHPFKIPRVQHVAGGEIPLESLAHLHGTGKLDEVLLKRVLYGISCRNYEAAAAAVPGAIGLSSSTVSRNFTHASAQQLQSLQERDLSELDILAIFLDGKTFADMTMVVAVGITLTGEKHVLGFVETGTENEAVLTPFLQELEERGLTSSQGLLFIIDGGKGLRSAVRQAFGDFRPGAAMPVAQAGECGEAFTERRPDHVATPTATGVSAPNVCRSQSRAHALADGTGGSQSIGGPEFGGRPRGNVDVASTRSVCALGLVLQDDKLSGIHQCLGRRAMCQGGSLDELQSAATVVGHGVAGYRATAPQSQGLSALATLT